MRAITVPTTGGPDVMTVDEIAQPTAGPGEVLVRVQAAGVNFIDTYQRSGLYPMDTPYVPGLEGAGEVVALGPGVDVTGARGATDTPGADDDATGRDDHPTGPEDTSVAVGDTVAWTGTLGSYAEYVTVPLRDIYPVPDGVEARTAAAMMLQGLTAHYLSASVYPLREGDVALVHAGAGGVGLLLTQLSVSRGARVIATASTADKADLAHGAGASDVIRYDQFADMAADLPAALRDLTGGAGAHVVYDGVGAATFDASLASLRPRGMMVLFGSASGPVPPLDLQRLNRGGSLTVTRPSMGHFLATSEERAWRSGELFAAVAQGRLNVRIGHTYPLDQAVQAQTALEGRQTTGKVLLEP